MMRMSDIVTITADNPNGGECIMTKRAKRIKKFIKAALKSGRIGWGNKRIQMFTTRNIAGDAMETIYDDGEIQIDYAPGYNYIEIFGLTNEEYEYIRNEVGDILSD